MPKAAPKQKPMTLDEISEHLAHDIYEAGHWFEKAEGFKLIHGNGHRIRVSLATVAVMLLKAGARTR